MAPMPVPPPLSGSLAALRRPVSVPPISHAPIEPLNTALSELGLHTLPGALSEMGLHPGGYHPIPGQPMQGPNPPHGGQMGGGTSGGFHGKVPGDLAGRLRAFLAQYGGAASAGGGTAPSGVDSGYNPAQYQRAIGNTAQAVHDWEAHHPYAMSHGQIPGWVRRYLAMAAASSSTPPPPPPAAY